MTAFVVDNYLPELSLSDVESNRHRECHRLTTTLPPNLRLHLEIHSVDLKLFEGRDFDFLPSNNAQDISLKSREMLAKGEKIVEIIEEESKESMISFDDEYVSKAKQQ